MHPDDWRDRRLREIARGDAHTAVGGLIVATHLMRRLAGSGDELARGRAWNRVVAHRGWLSVRDRALAGLASRPALVVVLGESGTGKTFLMRELTRVLRAGGIAAHLVPAGEDGTGLDAADDRSVLVIDDAGRFEPAALARLTTQGPRLVVLADRPRFVTRLAELAMPPLLLRLSPLDPREVAGFLAASAAPGREGALAFSDEATASLAGRSGGVPRLLHDLAASALFLANREGAASVETRHVDQAAVVGDAAAVSDVAPAARTPPPAAPPDVVSTPSVPHVQASAARRGPPSSRVAAAAVALVLLAAVVVAGLRTASLPQVRRITAVSATPAPPIVIPAARPPLEQTPELVAVPAVRASPRPDTALEPPTPVAAPSVAAPPIIVEASRSAPVVETPPSIVEASPALPSGPFTTVAIRFPAGDAQAGRRAATVASGLRDGGFAVDGPLGAPVREPAGASYVFAEDRAAAEEVARAARRIAATLPAMPARRRPGEREPPPRPGTIQLVILGEGT